MAATQTDKKRQDRFGNPVDAYSTRMLAMTLYDCINFGIMRHRQRCRHGRDWKNPQSKTLFVYRQLDDLIAFIYGKRFGLMVDQLELDLEFMQEILLRLIMGPSVEGLD